ncbi:uncharacterized protein [Tenebrio molitor]|uniref:uncharacterized protein n=1 Tax=Tenebrio molitor TaxID=7067 RepID=UPI00362482CF
MSNNYPEYLNPFAENAKSKSKLTIRNSFKEFGRNLRQSFRVKKKEEEDVVIRQRNDTVRRLPLSYSGPQADALPRSRFRERLSKSQLRADTSGPNPFEEGEESDTQSVSRIIRRKGKKRAPLPPKSFSSQNVNDDNLEVPTRGSHWSLTSTETDYSFSTSNTNREEYQTESRKDTILSDLKDFNKEMEKLKDDTNNNVIIKEEAEKTESNNNIPDLVISCPGDTDAAKADEEKEDSKSKELIDKDDKSDTSEELIVNDITCNMKTDEQIDTKPENQEDDQKTEEENFLYHEKKSLYIAGSRDELNECNTYTGRISLFITGSRDDLDGSNNNSVCNKSVIDENSNDDAVPIPKQRKNKLSKNILLGV